MNDDDLLDHLFAISGSVRGSLDDTQRLLVLNALNHPREDIRERAIFIGGLRCMDPLFLRCFVGSVLLGEESSLGNRRLMVECLVSASIERKWGGDKIIEILRFAKNYYVKGDFMWNVIAVSVRRLEGKISKQEFASLDYDALDID